MSVVCIDVSLLSGRTARITRETSCSIEEFKQEALASLQLGAGVLLTASGEALCQGTLEEAGLKDGDALLLQQRQADLLQSLELDLQLSKERGVSFQTPGRFTDLELAARGAYSTTCSARDESTGGMVAIKKMEGALADLQHARKTLKELKLLRHLGHENILALQYVFLSGIKSTFNDLYIVSDLMETDLASILRSSQLLLDQHCQFFSYQMLRGLKFMHSAGVMHLDLKPRNVLLNTNCDLRISDFTYAVVDFGGRGETFLPGQNEGYAVGNRWYRAPEALCHYYSYSVYGPTIDTWSVGAILAEMFARRPLFPGKSLTHHLQLILKLLGPWDASSFAWIKNPEAREFLESQSPSASRALSETVGATSPSAMELVDALLQFNPEHRATAEQALNMSYFGDLRCPEDEPSSTPLDLRDFEFLRRRIDLAGLREEIFLEALRYHPEQMQRYEREQTLMGTMHDIQTYPLLEPGEEWPPE